jgi:type IV secretory pathway VirB2 component (pilin)
MNEKMSAKGGSAFGGRTKKIICQTLVLFFLISVLALPSLALAQTTFTNPLKFSTITEVLTSLLSFLQGAVVTVAIVFIVIGGILYMTSAGNEKRITTAKNCWTGAVIGLAIVLAGPSLLKDVMTVLGSNGSANNPQVSSAPGLQQIAANILAFLLSIVGIIAIISLVIGGIMYMTSYGDDKRMETGKKIFTYSIIGIVISLASLVIVKQVGTLMGMSW